MSFGEHMYNVSTGQTPRSGIAKAEDTHTFSWGRYSQIGEKFTLISVSRPGILNLSNMGILEAVLCLIGCLGCPVHHRMSHFSIL